MNQAQSAIFANFVNAMASMAKQPLLFGPYNRPLQPSPGMKFFRDLNDYLDAELVSNIVTATNSYVLPNRIASPCFSMQNIH